VVWGMIWFVGKETVILEAATKAFESEGSRTEFLQSKFEKLTAGVAAVMGFELIDIKNLLKSPYCQVRLLCWLAVAALTCSLFAALVSMRVANYEGFPRGNKLLDTLEADGVTEMEAEDALAGMLVAATESNATVNDNKASWLAWSAWLLLGGFISVITSQLLNAV
jgi:hypothetical protein